jgi:hypothetical protein
MKNIISKAIFPSLIVVVTILYLVLSPSYQKSIKAKYYYLIGDYETAYIISTQSYKLNRYNKMAFSIRQQSLIHMKYIDFLKNSLDRYTQIRRIVNKDKITRGDKLKIKIICEIVFDEFKQLNHTILTRKDLIKRAEEQNNNYKELYEDVKNKL